MIHFQFRSIKTSSAWGRRHLFESLSSIKQYSMVGGWGRCSQTRLDRSFHWSALQIKNLFWLGCVSSRKVSSDENTTLVRKNFTFFKRFLLEYLCYYSSTNLPSLPNISDLSTTTKKRCFCRVETADQVLTKQSFLRQSLSANNLKKSVCNLLISVSAFFFFLFKDKEIAFGIVCSSSHRWGTKKE